MDFYQRFWVEKFAFLKAESSGKNKYPYWPQSEVIPWGHLFSGLRIKTHPPNLPSFYGSQGIRSFPHGAELLGHSGLPVFHTLGGTRVKGFPHGQFG